ncbi:MAG: amidase [Geminicoccaceae bacterium]
MNDHELLSANARDLHDLYRSRSLSPVDVARACLEAAHRHQERFCAFSLIDDERALAAARASQERFARKEPLGPLDGIPGTIKDLVLAEGWPTRRGSHTTGDPAPETRDAPVVRALRATGMVFLGKTTTPEFGWKALTDNPLGEIARNPWNERMTAGGSSGGAAIAAALGMGVMHIGTDGGGSIRIPAGLTGTVGLKPTFGRVPAYPPSPYGTVSHVGPMTRSVVDTALMLDAMSVADLDDWYAVPAPAMRFADALDARSREGGFAGMRIAVSPDLGFIDVHPDVLDLFEQAVSVFARLGARIERVTPPLGQPFRLFTDHWYTGAANLLETIPEGLQDRIDPGLREIASKGRELSSTRQRHAQLERARLGTAMQQFFADHDLLLTPSVAIPAFEAGHEVPPGSGLERWIEWAGFSYPFNLTQQPAMSVPAGLTAQGLPAGLQIVGAKFDEGKVLAAAAAFEAARPWPRLAPPATMP